MKNIILFSSIAVASGVLFTNIYTSVVDARSWGGSIPHSIETARQYYSIVSPGNFFRVISPANQILCLLALILLWKTAPQTRYYLAGAFILYVLADIFTFAYFYPRNDIMFKTGNLADIETLKTAWKGWDSMNWLRSCIILIGLICSFLALNRLYLAK